jgi:hypothetical protein
MRPLSASPAPSPATRPTQPSLANSYRSAPRATRRLSAGWVCTGSAAAGKARRAGKKSQGKTERAGRRLRAAGAHRRPDEVGLSEIRR